MSLFISDAYANAPGAAPDAVGAFGNFLLPVMLLAIFYFIAWRPQAKRAKELKLLMEGLKKGDEVVFAGGLLGRITKVDDEYAVVEINDNLTVKVQKGAIAATLPTGTLKNITQN